MFFNVALSPVSDAAFERGSPEELATASLRPGPCWDEGAKRGCPPPHRDGLRERTQRGKGGIQGEQGRLWSDTEAETTKPQVNFYPRSKNLQPGDPGGRGFEYTPSLALSYSIDQKLPFSGQILLPLLGNNSILILMQSGAGSCRVWLRGCRLARGSFWGESWLRPGTRRGAGTQAAREPAEALKWSFSLIPAAPPARSRTSPLRSSGRPGTSLLGAIILGKNILLRYPAERGGAALSKKAAIFSSETLPRKNSSPTHVLV